MPLFAIVRGAWLGPLCALFWSFASGCGAVPPRPASTPHSAEPAAELSPVWELAGWIPAEAERCSVAVPTRLAAAERPLAALISQTDRLPWALSLDVIAYARGERAHATGRRAVVEYLRFARADRAQIEAELGRALDRPLSWEEHPEAAEDCAGELTCLPLQARFLDARTVQLAHGDWGERTEGPNRCLAVLAAHPEALEVSARAAWLSGTDLRDSETRLAVAPAGLERAIVKRYAGAEAAERALREARRGRDELSVLAGVPANALGVRRGDLIEQRAAVSFEDLRLALEDQARAAAAVQRADAPRALAEIDARDPDAVRAAFDARLRGAAEPPGPELMRLEALLARARALSPEDDGLARRHYQLRLSWLRDARGAYEVAAESVQRGLGDAEAWQLRKRSALARYDEPRLRAELRSAHALTAEAAGRMASELARKTRAGEEYERAEWAFLAAQQLARDARRGRRAPRALRFALDELPRLLAYLGQSASEPADLGVHVLAFGEHTPPAAPGGAGSDRALWIAETAGGARPGTIFAATTWDDAQLIALGRALAGHTREGPLELIVGLERLGRPGRASLVLSGRRQGAELVVEHVSVPLDALRWPSVERLLSAPLRLLTGAIYPPDELAIYAADSSEAIEVARAAEAEPRVRCSGDGLAVRCRGTLADPGAARRALLAVARALLAAEARGLWSGSD